MATTLTTLSASSRTQTGKGAARKLRADGRIPAIVYGPGAETRQLSVNANEVARLFSRISVENTLIELNVDEGDPVRVLVREVQSHVYRPEILHIDFYEVRRGEKITLETPIQILGTPAGVVEGGVLNHNLTSLEIRCEPAQIPDSIDVDVAGLEIGDSIHVGDLELPEGVEAVTDAEQPICSVVAPTIEPIEPDAEVDEEIDAVIEPELIDEREPDDEEEVEADEE